MRPKPDSRKALDPYPNPHTLKPKALNPNTPQPGCQDLGPSDFESNGGSSILRTAFGGIHFDPYIMVFVGIEPRKRVRSGVEPIPCHRGV